MKNKTNTTTAETDQNAIGSPYDAFMATVSLMRIAAALGLPKSTINEIIAKAGIISDRGFPLGASCKAIVDHYKGMSEAESAQATKDRNAIIAMQREQTAISLSNEQGKLLPKDAMRRMIEGLFVSMREEIRKCEGLTLDQKKLVTTAMSKATIPDESLTE
jgi:hypothetical protein